MKNCCDSCAYTRTRRIVLPFSEVNDYYVFGDDVHSVPVTFDGTLVQIDRSDLQYVSVRQSKMFTITPSTGAAITLYFPSGNSTTYAADEVVEVFGSLHGFALQSDLQEDVTVDVVECFPTQPSLGEVSITIEAQPE